MLVFVDMVVKVQLEIRLHTAPCTLSWPKQAASFLQRSYNGTRVETDSCHTVFYLIYRRF